MTTNVSRRETERTKLIQEKCQTLLTQMLRDEDNKYCVDCDAKGPRWASWNLGIFLCIRCAGIHRNLGVHISRVKSVNLDTWTPEQVISLQQMGNSRARAVYEAQLPDGFRRPQTDNALESFIRAKYEHKKYLAREWVPPSPPKVDWVKEVDEELERQKRKKKAAQASNALGIGVISSGGGGDKKCTAVVGQPTRTVPLPAPLPKPKAGQGSGSPKTQRLSAGASAAAPDQQTSDLLGLSTPTTPPSQCSAGDSVTHDLQNDSFSGFLSAPPKSIDGAISDASQGASDGLSQGSAANNSLAKEEQDFFNQGSLAGMSGSDKDKSGKLTKDSILALYAATPSNPHNQQFGQPQAAVHQQQLFPQNNFAGGAPVTHNFTGMSPGFMSGALAVAPSQQQQQQPHNQQFMTPPNSASMYNSPVMTAPTAFSTPGMSGGGMHLGVATSVAGGGGAGFGAQFPSMSHVGYTAQMQPAGLVPQHMMTMGSGIMATGQTTVASNAAQLMQGNLSRLPLSMMSGMLQQQQPPLQQMTAASGGGIQTTGASLGGSGLPPRMGSATLTAFQTPITGSAAAAASAANLNQQFGNLNIGNVWQ